MQYSYGRLLIPQPLVVGQVGNLSYGWPLVLQSCPPQQRKFCTILLLTSDPVIELENLYNTLP